MPVAFTNDDFPVVETVREDNVRAGFAFEDEDSDSDEGSGVSLSDYQSDIGSAPEWAWLGAKECRALFELASDKKAGIGARCCGRNMATCGRNGHGILEKGQIGWYKTVATRKYVDGVASTHLTDPSYQEMVEARKMAAKTELTELMTGMDISPSESEELGYAAIVKRGLLKEGDQKPAGRELLPALRTPRGNTSGGLLPVIKTPRGKEGDVDWKMKSPTMETVQKVGGESNAMPALAGMLDTLTQSVRLMVERVEMLEKEKEPDGMARTVSGSKRYWYGVINGKDGSKVYGDWGSAGAMTTGKSGASSKKFGSIEEAEEFVDNYLRAGVLEQAVAAVPTGYHCFYHGSTGRHLMVRNWIDGGDMRYQAGVESGFFREHESALEWLDDKRGHGARVGAREEGPSVMVTPQREASKGKEDVSYGPDGRFFGSDASAGKEGEAYGIDINGSEEDLRTALCPPGMSEIIGSGLANAMVDVVGQIGVCGTDGGESELESNDIELIGEALQTLVQQGRSQYGNGSGGRTDLQWNSKKRVSIRNIKDLSGLRKATRILTRLRDKVYKRMVKASTNACRRAGWVDSHRTELWATGGPMTKIVMGTLEAYLALHQHWLEISEVDRASWAYVKLEVEHHTDELEVLRGTSECRLQALLYNYIHLRDGLKNNWYYSKLQTQRNLRMMATDDASKVSSITDGGSLICRKCHTCLHDGGSAACPWAKKSDEVAVLCGKDALRELGKKGKENDK
jgi:hypothetical protein